MKLDLETLKDALESYDFQCAIQPPKDEFPIGQLFVNIGKDDKDRPWLLQLRIYHESLEESGEGNELYFLNLFLGLPFQVEESQFGDLARLCLMLNKISAVPAFGMSENDKVCYFNYTLLFKDATIDEDLLLATLGMVIYLLQNFSPSFESVGCEGKSLEQVLKEAEEIVSGT